MEPSHNAQPLTVKEVAAHLRVGLSTVYDAIKSGKLRAFGIGKNRKAYRVWPADLAAFLNEVEVRPRSNNTCRPPKRAMESPGLTGYTHLTRRKRAGGEA